MNIVLLCWRDTDHPEGGGSERYLERVAGHLALQGHRVVFRTARYPGSARCDVREPGVTFWRGGGQFSVYPLALCALLAARLGRGYGPLRGMGRPDVVVDTQNGIPFFASVVSGAPTVVLTHHCHREQWSVAGPLLARVGWFIESRLSPLVHRRNKWVTVSQPSAQELAELGIAPGQIEIIRNGVDRDGVAGDGAGHSRADDGGAGELPGVEMPAAADCAVPGDDTSTTAAADTATSAGPSAEPAAPRLVTLSRLVPHKQIEHAIDVISSLRKTHPAAQLDIIGSGWWEERLRDYAREVGVADRVVFHGHVTEQQKHAILAGADVHVMPSRKEGWGLAVIEAGIHGVPTVGYEASAGLRDSVVDEVTGLLAGSPGGLINAVESLLDDPALRRRMGEAARERSAQFSWSATGRAWERVLEDVVARRG